MFGIMKENKELKQKVEELETLILIRQVEIFNLQAQINEMKKEKNVEIIRETSEN